MANDEGAILATQPPADVLLDYAGMLDRIDRLAESPRVWSGTAGLSHEGRQIPYVVVAAAETVDRLEYHRREMRQMFAPRVRHHTLRDVEVSDGEGTPSPQLVPVLLIGASFGNEAAHVEALLQLAEMLATSEAQHVRQVMERLIVIVMPLVNPDGREAALAEWRHHRKSAALTGSVNAWGQLLNRDFLWLTQPETRAVMRVYREWHPVAAYDPHEDMFMLGVSRPETCWTPPFARPVHPELHPGVVSAIDEMGHAIARRWREQGFNMLYHPQGRHDFMTLFRLGGRFHLGLALHGTPALITESARTPGTQTWDERLQQKITAGLAVTDLVARCPSLFLDAVRASRSVDVSRHDAYVLPHESNPPGGLRQLVETLLRHEVLVYRTQTPPAYVVPTTQPEARLIRSLLDSSGWNLVALLPALGVTAVRVAEMSSVDRDTFMQVPLQPVRRVDYLGPSRSRLPWQSSAVAMLNTPVGVSTLNALWKEGARVRWLTAPTHAGHREIPRGAFLAVGARVIRLPEGIRWGDDVIELGEEPQSLAALSLTPPRIGLYIGTGVDDRYLPLKGEIQWALKELGFEWTELREQDVTSASIQQFSVLIMPGGDPKEIVNGASGQYPWQRPPWDVVGSPKGIGKEGVEALRQFVQRGGTYVGIGLGGAALAGPEYAGLLAVAVTDHSLGEARVIVRITQMDHRLALGFGNSEADGDIFQAYYYSEPSAGILGGPILSATHLEDVVAVFDGLADGGGSTHLRNPDHTKLLIESPAIIHARVGQGNAIVFSFSPTFRCGWISTHVLLSNAILTGAVWVDR